MKFLIVFLFVALPVFAQEIVNPAPKIKKQEDPGDGCLSQNAVALFARSGAVNALVKEPAPQKNKKSLSLRAVRIALEKHGFVKAQPDLGPDVERGGAEDNLQAQGDRTDQPARQSGITRPLNAKDSSYWLEANGYFNLTKCPEWKKRLQDPRQVPPGAVVVYRHPRDDKHPGHIEIKTPSGFWSDHPRNAPDYSPGMDVVGVFVKP